MNNFDYLEDSVFYEEENQTDPINLKSTKNFISLQSNITYDESLHEIKVNLTLKTNNFETILKKTLSEVISLYYEMQYEKFYIVSEKMIKLIHYYEEEELGENFYKSKSNFTKQAINQFFNEISNRDDIITSNKAKQFQKIADIKYSSMLPPKFLMRLSSNLCSEEIGIHDFVFDYQKGIYIMALNAYGTISNMGRIWSIMQKNILGGLEIFKGTQNQKNQLPEMKKVYARNFEYKIQSSHLRFDNIYVDIYQSHNNGKIFRLRINTIIKESKIQLNEYQIQKQPIIKLVGAEDKIIIVAEQALRIFCLKEMICKGGGSLNSRLGNGVIVDVVYDHSTEMIFIMGSNNTLYIYRIFHDWDLKYIFEKSFEEEKQKFKIIDYDNCNLFIMSNDLLGIYKIKQLSNDITFFNVGNFKRDKPINLDSKLIDSFNCFCHDTVNSFVYVGDSAGHIFVFDINTGKLVSSIFAHVYKVIKIIYVNEINSFISVSKEEVKFWRLGEITPQLTGEIRKHVENLEN